MEAYKFEVFKYDDINEETLEIESSQDKSQKSIISPEHSLSDFSSTSIGESNNISHFLWFFSMTFLNFNLKNDFNAEVFL